MLTSLPTPTTTTVTAIGPSGVNVCTVEAPTPVTSGSGGRHKSFNDTMSLADRIGITKTPHVVKMLKECIFTHKLGGKITTTSHCSVPPASASSTVPTKPAPIRCASVTDLTTISDESDIDSDSSKECSLAPPDTNETLSHPLPSTWYQDLLLATYCDEFLNSEHPCIMTPEVNYDDDEVSLGDQAECEDFWGKYNMHIGGAAGTYHDQYSDGYDLFYSFSIHMADTLTDSLLVKSDVSSDFSVPIAHVYNCPVSGCAECNGLCAKKSKKPLWILDSGASKHFTFTLSNFLEYIALKHPIDKLSSTDGG
jgi:hypothetical protein